MPVRDIENVNIKPPKVYEINEDNDLTLTLSAFDIEGDILTYSAYESNTKDTKIIRKKGRIDRLNYVFYNSRTQMFR